MQTVTQSLIDRLEAMVDSHGLRGVLTALEEVCTIKSQKLLEKGQDEATAKVWSKNLAAIQRASYFVY